MNLCDLKGKKTFHRNPQTLQKLYQFRYVFKNISVNLIRFLRPYFVFPPYREILFSIFVPQTVNLKSFSCPSRIILTIASEYGSV